ncbi:MAG: ROK family protein [Candidatus Gracilibacteria bacterium]|nr:ROK family protein [bacterium]MDZ4216967.1 ROK family protein [Candidatus Gracilibacteria bacterium]
MNILGIDLGATKIALAKYDSKTWQKICETQIPTENTVEEVIDQLAKLIHEYRDEETEAIGIGAPGPTINGIVEQFPNIPGIKHFNLKSILEKTLKSPFHLPITIENDANCFLMGAWQKGKYCDNNNLIGLTLGTGVGGAIISEGKLIRGENGAAGEFGHLLIRDKQTLEELISGPALARRWEDQFHESSSGEEIVEAAENGNQKAMRFLEHVGKDLGIALANLILTFNPEVILIGGSAAEALPFYQDSISEIIRKNDQFTGTQIPIVQANGEDFATFGSAWLAANNNTA